MNAAHAALRWLQHGSLRLRLLLGTLVWLVLAVAVRPAARPSRA
jgi:hypothetical protein